MSYNADFNSYIIMLNDRMVIASLTTNASKSVSPSTDNYQRIH